MKLVFQGNNIIEAHIVSGLLNAHGLASHVGGHYLQGAIGDLPATDFAHVFVDEADVSEALQLIEDYEAGRLNSD